VTLKLASPPATGHLILPLTHPIHMDIITSWQQMKTQIASTIVQN